MPALAILFFCSGCLVEKAKRNFFIGIRTPWTLSSDIVWEKTHKVGGKLFKLTGICAFFGAFFPEYSFVIFISAVMLAVFFSFIYSYFVYIKQKRD
jgi:uncharacterized membrane protein